MKTTFTRECKGQRFNVRRVRKGLYQVRLEDVRFTGAGSRPDLAIEDLRKQMRHAR